MKSRWFSKMEEAITSKITGWNINETGASRFYRNPEKLRMWTKQKPSTLRMMPGSWHGSITWKCLFGIIRPKYHNQALVHLPTLSWKWRKPKCNSIEKSNLRDQTSVYEAQNRTEVNNRDQNKVISIVWIFLSPYSQVFILISNSQWDAILRQGFWEVTMSRGQDWMNRSVSLKKETQRTAVPLPCENTAGRCHSHEKRNGPLLDTESASTLNLGLLNLQGCNKFLLFMSFPICDSLDRCRQGLSEILNII